MKTFLSVFIFSLLFLLVFPTRAEPILTKSPPGSETELLDRFTAATKAKDEADIRSLICWDGPVVKDQINRDISDLLSTQRIRKIYMHPLHPREHFTNILDGTLYYPNIPIIGWLDVKRGLGVSAVRFRYGKKADAFYISCDAAQKLP